MLKILVQTNAEYLPVLARIVLGFFVFYYASQLMPGWFANYGFRGSRQFFSLMIGEWRPGNDRCREITVKHDSMISDGVPVAF
jgi:hypothetical protein